MTIRATLSFLNAPASVPTALPQIIRNPTLPLGVRTATKRSGSFTAGSQDSAGKRRGVKKNGGEWVRPGNIILRQKGTQWHPGENVHMGRDFTIVASEPGWVQFYTNPLDKTKGMRKYVGVALKGNHKLPSNPALPRWRRLGLREVDPTEYIKEKKVYY